jgi:phosphatidylglycerol lysyltransferase
LKLGEEAVVPLEPFSLEGSARKGLRRALRSAESEGCSFAVATLEQVPALLPDLRRVSDQWLASKSTREKGFSLGFFDEAYVRRYPQALGLRAYKDKFDPVWEPRYLASPAGFVLRVSSPPGAVSCG